MRRKFVVSIIMVFLLMMFAGCETEEQKAARFSEYMHKSWQEIQESTSEAQELEKLLEEYKENQDRNGAK